jgi:hypothetical protein
VLTFSDLQAEIAAELIRHGIAVHAFDVARRGSALMERLIAERGHTIAVTHVGGSGPHQAAALRCALNHSGSPDPRLDRICITDVVLSCPNWMSFCATAGYPRAIDGVAR